MNSRKLILPLIVAAAAVACGPTVEPQKEFYASGDLVEVDHSYLLRDFCDADGNHDYDDVVDSITTNDASAPLVLFQTPGCNRMRGNHTLDLTPEMKAAIGAYARARDDLRYMLDHARWEDNQTQNPPEADPQ